ncbi:MAG TPA: ACT domain-containing protein [candidate division WOR-3 bacterium]|uniref:aspartate kinase n=1 Tax=candidate division WOR-3 bacterium TaxID=2052148 RepID=A0A9C9K0K2_UNCW3|nr:ACT domain-containing protein [candidate division WOR-3 bacterium]
MKSKKNELERLIEGVDYNIHLAKITVCGVTDRPGVAAELFSILGQHGLNVELISTGISSKGHTDISFAVAESDFKTTYKILDKVKEKFGSKEIIVDEDCALITIYGPMLATTPGVAGKIFSLLSERKVNIEMISASLSALNIIVKKQKVMDAVGALSVEFGI